MFCGLNWKCRTLSTFNLKLDSGHTTVPVPTVTLIFHVVVREKQRPAPTCFPTAAKILARMFHVGCTFAINVCTVQACLGKILPETCWKPCAAGFDVFLWDRILQWKLWNVYAFYFPHCPDSNYNYPFHASVRVWNFHGAKFWPYPRTAMLKWTCGIDGRISNSPYFSEMFLPKKQRDNIISWLHIFHEIVGHTRVPETVSFIPNRMHQHDCNSMRTMDGRNPTLVANSWQLWKGEYWHSELSAVRICKIENVALVMEKRYVYSQVSQQWG